MKYKAKVLMAAVLILAATLTVVWQNKSQELMATAASALSSELAGAIGTNVQVGSMKIGAFNSITIDGISIYDHNDQLLLSAEEVNVAVSLWRILQGQTSIAAINAITVVRPVMTLSQRPDGQWNIEDLLDSTTSGDLALQLKLSVLEGTAMVSSTAGQWRLQNINGSLNLEQQSATGIKFSFAHQAATADVRGFWGGKRGSLTIKADHLALADYQALLPADGSIQLSEGTATAIEAMVSQNNGKISYAGEARIQDGAIRIDDIPLREIQGLITFTENDLNLFNTVKVFEQPLKLRGKITTFTTEPVLNLSASSPAFDPAAVKADFPVQGVIAFDADITGLAANPKVSGHFSLKQARVYEQTVQDAEIDLSYADQLLQLEDFRGKLLGGSVAAQGTVELQTQQFNLHIRGSQLDSAALADFIPGLSGYADIDIIAVGDRDIDRAVIYGTASMNAGRYQGIAFNRLNGSFYKNGPDLAIDYVNVGLGQGTATASGVMVNQRLNFSVRGNGLPLQVLAARQPELQLDGTAAFSGTVAGTVERPDLQAEFTAVNGQVLAQPFTAASGKVRLSDNQLVLQNVALTDGAARHTVDGSIGLAGAQVVDLTVSSRQARAENLVKLLIPGEQLTGNVDNDVRLTGPLNNISASGHIVLSEGSFRGFLIASGSGGYALSNGQTTISDFVIHSLNTQVKIGGVIDPNQQLDLDITAQDVDIAKLHLRSPYPIAGQAAFAGKLRGTPTSPVFTGRLSAERLSFNAQQLEQVAGDLNIVGNQIDITSFGFRQGDGSFTFSGGLNLSSEEIYGNVEVDNGQLAALLAILNTPVEGVDGRLNGEIVISGNMARPNVALTGQLNHGQLKKYPLDHIEIDVALTNNIVTVKQFTAQQGQGILAVYGTADLDGPLNLEVGGRDIDAGLITNWFDSSIETKGKLDFAAQVTGTAHSPSANVSLEITGGGVANATFDSLYGLLVLEQGNINVNQLMLSKGNYRASAYGVIPVAALTAQGRQQGAVKDQMDLKVRLDEADLSIMPLLTKEVAWAVGRTQGELAIGGTLAQPTVTGSILVKDGVMKLTSLADPIQKVGLDIQFAGDKINLNTFEGLMGGGSFSLTGSAKLSGLTMADYYFNLKLDKLGVKHKYFKGPLNGELTFASGPRRPKLAGRLVFENATADIPYLPEMNADSPNIALDVEVIAGKKVRLYNPYMYDIWADGRVKFGGTTRRPDVSGRLTASRGTVSYLRTSFNIKEASAEFTQLGSFAPVIKLNAETRLDRTKVFLDINGPVGEMDFRLTAEPAMSHQEILSLLTLRSRYFDKQNGDDSGLGRDELLTLLDAGLQIRFVAELESAFRKAFGLDEFRLVRDTLDADSSETIRDREVYNIEIGKYLTDRFMLNYTMGVGYNDNNKIGFRYELTRRMSLIGSYEKLDGEMIGIETRFKF